MESQYQEELSGKTQSIIFRSKIRWYEQGEKNSKYFYGLEKLNYNNKVMRAIILADKTITRDQKKILLEQHKFYRKLCTTDKKVIFTYENETEIKVTPEDKEDLETPLTLEEYKKALMSVQDSKTPGCDGISTNWYQVFWDNVKLTLFHAYEHAIEVGTLHQSARRGVMCLISKKDRDSLIKKNWRTCHTFEY